MKFGEVTWIYQADRIVTNANAAGNPIILDLSLATGQLARIVAVYFTQTAAAATHAHSIQVLDEDNVQMCYIANVAAAATTNSNLPSIGTSASASNNIADSVGLLIPAGAKLSFIMTGNSGAAGDTCQLVITLELFNKSDVPTWSIARSTNAANITIAASTISAANTITTGRLWT